MSMHVERKTARQNHKPRRYFLRKSQLVANKSRSVVKWTLLFVSLSVYGENWWSKSMKIYVNSVTNWKAIRWRNRAILHFLLYILRIIQNTNATLGYFVWTMWIWFSYRIHATAQAGISCEKAIITGYYIVKDSF